MHPKTRLISPLVCRPQAAAATQEKICGVQPVYRPQPAAGTVQSKLNGTPLVYQSMHSAVNVPIRQATPAPLQSKTKAMDPPVYRMPQTAKGAQPKIEGLQPFCRPVQQPHFPTSHTNEPSVTQTIPRLIGPPVYQPLFALSATQLKMGEASPSCRTGSATTVLRPKHFAGSGPPPMSSRNGVSPADRRNLVQMTPEDAAKFIESNNIAWRGKISKKNVEAFCRDSNNSEAHRSGLLAAWNKGVDKGQFIKIVSDEARLAATKVHALKAKRETANKLRGDQLLKMALDAYQMKGLKGVASISGFRICRYKRGVAVAISRATGKAESKAMKQSHSIERVEHSDPYKWFSESQAHTEKFENYVSTDTGAKLVIWLDGDKYLTIRQRVEHEFLSSGVEANRFHQENVSGHAHLINLGIHLAEQEEFHAAVIDVKDLSTAAAEESFEVSAPAQAAPVPTLRMTGEELLFATLAGYRNPGMLEDWRRSNEYLWYEDEVLTFGSPIPPYRRQLLIDRIRQGE